ncbi:MAG: hypothetical protein ACKPEO_19115 [Sphaerospermopsis kisseleviana]
MMRIIRVKSENQTAVITALKNAGFEAHPSFATPLSQWEHEHNESWDFEDWTFQSIVGMAGIETSASGNQAHRVIQSLKQQGVIK